MTQPKQVKMLRLMQMMSGNDNYSVEELSERLELTPRAIYKYIDSFKGYGYVVEETSTNVYKIVSAPPDMPDFSQLLHFSKEEAHVVNSVIDSLSADNGLQKGIREKMSVIYDKTEIV